MELQVSKGQTQVGFPIVGIQLQRGLEVGGSLSRFLEIIQHEAALDISRGHFRIPLQSDREILHGKIQVAIVCVDIPRNQGQVFVFGKNGLVLVDQSQTRHRSGRGSKDRRRDRPTPSRSFGSFAITL